MCKSAVTREFPFFTVFFNFLTKAPKNEKKQLWLSFGSGTQSRVRARRQEAGRQFPLLSVT